MGDCFAIEEQCEFVIRLYRTQTLLTALRVGQIGLSFVETPSRRLAAPNVKYVASLFIPPADPYFGRRISYLYREPAP